MSSRTRTSLAGLMALASLAACTGATAPPPSLGRASNGAAATVATFEGRFDPATGKLTFQTTPTAEATSRLGRSAYEPFKDGVANSGPDNSFELVTDASPVPGFDAAGCGGVGSFDGNITVRSFFKTQTFSSVYVELTSVTGGHEACNSAGAVDGMSAVFGLWNYGAFAVNGSASRPWSFRHATSEAFVFRGRIMATLAPLAAPANGLTAFEWTPSMFMDPPHSFQDVGTTLSHVKWNGTSFTDSKSVLSLVAQGSPGSTIIGLTYPPQAYASGFSGADYFIDASAGAVIGTTGAFTVCAKFKPGAHPLANNHKVIVALGDPVDNATSVGWALVHHGPIPAGTEPEYAFIYRTGLDGDVTRSFAGPQGLNAGLPASARAYEYVCGGRDGGNIRVGTFGQVAGFDVAVTGTIPSPATLPVVIGNASTLAYPYDDGGVYEVIFDSRAPTLAVMNEIVAAAEGRTTYNGAAFPGVPFPAVPLADPAGLSVTGTDGQAYLLPIGASYPLTTDASGLLDSGKVVAFGGTTAGFGPVLPAGTTDYCFGAEIDAADWTTASGCAVGWNGGGEFGIFFTNGTIAGTNGSAYRALASPVPSAGRHKVTVCYATPALPGEGQAHLYVDGVLAGSTSGLDGYAPFDIVAGQVQVGTCNLAGPLTGARIGRVFACPSADPAACN